MSIARLSGPRPLSSSLLALIVGALGAMGALALGAMDAKADPTSSAPDAVDLSTVVVARFGDRTVTAAELERRIAEMAPFQLRMLSESGDPVEIRRAVLERFILKDLLFAREAEARKLGDHPEVGDRLRGVHRSALVEAVRAEVTNEGVTEDEIRAFYRENLDRFVAPRKLALSQIVVATRAEAEALISELSPPEAKRFAEVAREKSLDKETNQRGGNLGFVTPEGETAQRGLKVPKALVEAADGAQDGQLVPEPVAVEGGFAVVWRRQTLRPITRTLADEEPAIRRLLAQQRIHGALRDLVQELFEQHVTEMHPDLCDAILVDPSGDLARAVRPGTLPRVQRVGRPEPESTPEGLR